MINNLVWWVITIILGLAALGNFYEAGKGEYTEVNNPHISLISGIIGFILFLWGFLTLVR